MFPMLVIESGIVMLFKPVQLQNAEDSMLVTLSGILMLVNPWHPKNAESPMLVTPFPITTVVGCLIHVELLDFNPKSMRFCEVSSPENY